MAAMIPTGVGGTGTEEEDQQAAYGIMKVSELKEILTQRGLPTTGKKSELVDRLQQSDAAAHVLGGGLDGSIAIAGSDEVAAGSSSNEDPAAVALSLSLAAATEEEEQEMYAKAELAAVTASRGPAAVSVVDSQSLSPALEAAAGISSPPLAAALRAPAAVAASSAIPAGVLPAAVKIDTTTLSVEERQALRRARFGTKTDEEKKLDRARRFGLSVPELEEEKRRLRAQRFFNAGGSTFGKTADACSAAAAETLEAQKRQRRAERFGIVSESEKKRRRAERFGILTEEEKLQRRLQRFAVGTDSSLSSSTAADAKSGAPAVPHPGTRAAIVKVPGA